MNLKRLYGAHTALVTPFKSNGELDEDGLRANVDFQIEQGIDGLVPVGTTGESPTLSSEEHKKVVEIVIDQTKGRVPVIAGTGSNNTKEALYYTKHAKDAGADAALIISPYYNKPTQEGLIEHYRKVAEEVDIPIIIYNVPSRTGKNVEAETVIKLSEVPNIVGVKEASCNLQQIMEIIRGTPDDFIVLSGEDSWTYSMMGLGAVGAISVSSNIIPNELHRMCKAYLDGDIDTTKELHYKYLDLNKVIFVETNPGPIKEAMNMMGLAAGDPRLPLVRVSEKSRERIRDVMRGVNLLE